MGIDQGGVLGHGIDLWLVQALHSDIRQHVQLPHHEAGDGKVGRVQRINIRLLLRLHHLLHLDAQDSLHFRGRIQDQAQILFRGKYLLLGLLF